MSVKSKAIGRFSTTAIKPMNVTDVKPITATAVNPLIAYEKEMLKMIEDPNKPKYPEMMKEWKEKGIYPYLKK